MKLLRTIVIGLVLSFPFNTNAVLNNINNFTQLVQAVENGFDVRAVIHFNRCLLTTPELQEEVTRRLDDASARFDFTHFFHIKETVNERLIDSVSTSTNIFIESPSGDFFNMFSRLSVFEDNTAIFRVVFFAPLSTTKELEVNFLCTIDELRSGVQNNNQTNQNNVLSGTRNNVQRATVTSNNNSNNTNTSSTNVTNTQVDTQVNFQNNAQDEHGLILYNFF
ncbi:MAG: hypothetical protein H0U75_02260 [Legionella sp.]|nr:hypothetical protein [Legionella sp.]